jgi:hypothetical protein
MVEDKLLITELTRLQNKAQQLKKILKDVQDDLLGLSSAINEYSNPTMGGYQQSTLRQDIDQLISHLDQRIDNLLELEQDK